MSGYVNNSNSNGAACLLLLLLITRAAAQSDSNTPSSQTQTQSRDYVPYRNINASMMIIVVVFIVIFLICALMSVFIRTCADDNSDQEWSTSNSMFFHRRHASTGARFWKLNRRGLDTSIVESFPTFNSFSEIKKDRKIGNNAAIECAVCLNELDDEEGKILRLLPKCGHVFHRDCIDNWIASHNTCPVCRTDLSKNSSTTAGINSSRDDIVGETAENQISITIRNVVVHNNNNNNNTFPSEIKLRRSRSTGDLSGKVKRCLDFSSDGEGSSSERGNKERPPILQLTRTGSAAKNEGSMVCDCVKT